MKRNGTVKVKRKKNISNPVKQQTNTRVTRGPDPEPIMLRAFRDALKKQLRRQRDV